jgi:hypothetical protein
MTPRLSTTWSSETSLRIDANSFSEVWKVQPRTGHRHVARGASPRTWWPERSRSPAGESAVSPNSLMSSQGALQFTHRESGRCRSDVQMAMKIFNALVVEAESLKKSPWLRLQPAGMYRW